MDLWGCKGATGKTEMMALWLAVAVLAFCWIALFAFFFLFLFGLIV